VEDIAMRWHALVLAGAAVALGGCSEDATGPASCGAETTSVTPTVAVSQSVTFDWDPACGVALLLIEEDASDQWLVGTPESTWGSPDGANRIFPPVTYGRAPAGATERDAAASLVAGRTYELVLWRALAPGSTAKCLQNFENMCLLAVHEFRR
jgi:hypothetical protein